MSSMESGSSQFHCTCGGSSAWLVPAGSTGISQRGFRSSACSLAWRSARACLMRAFFSASLSTFASFFFVTFPDRFMGCLLSRPSGRSFEPFFRCHLLLLEEQHREPLSPVRPLHHQVPAAPQPPELVGRKPPPLPELLDELIHVHDHLLRVRPLHLPRPGPSGPGATAFEPLPQTLRAARLHRRAITASAVSATATRTARRIGSRGEGDDGTVPREPPIGTSGAVPQTT